MSDLYILLLILFFFYECYALYRFLHCFPTQRSFFFFKGSAAPRDLPFSPPRRSPDPPGPRPRMAAATPPATSRTLASASPCLSHRRSLLASAVSSSPRWFTSMASSNDSARNLLL